MGQEKQITQRRVRHGPPRSRLRQDDSRAGRRAVRDGRERRGLSGQPAQEPATWEKVEKRLAHAGVASRREVAQWLVAGRLQQRGQLLRPGDRLLDIEGITKDGRPLSISPKAPLSQGLVYYKPPGELVTHATGKPQVFERLPPPRQGRWVSVGRLDCTTSGLLLVVTDGELAHRLMHPRYGIEREYMVRIYGEASPGVLEQMRSGVRLADGPCAAEVVEPMGGEGRNRWYRMVLREGRYHAVKRLWEHFGLRVSRLIRVRYGPMTLPQELSRGQYRRLHAQELACLYQAVGLATAETPHA